MTGNIDKLPKWAREEIEQLRRDLKYATEERNELREKQFAGTGVVELQFRGWAMGEPNTVLPDAARIRFQLSDKEWITARRIDTPGGAYVHIMADSFSRMLAVHPEANTSLRIILVDRS